MEYLEKRQRAFIELYPMFFTVRKDINASLDFLTKEDLLACIDRFDKHIRETNLNLINHRPSDPKFPDKIASRAFMVANNLIEALDLNEEQIEALDVFQFALSNRYTITKANKDNRIFFIKDNRIFATLPPPPPNYA